MALTPIFAALLAFVYVYLTIAVIKHRFAKRISLGDSGDRDLRVAIRTHANFVEYVPFTLLLLWFVESFTYSSNLVFMLGSVLIIARIAHIIGMNFPKTLIIFRQMAVMATLMVIIICAFKILWHYLPA